ncbi:MAG: hypothetical protein AB7K71_26115 [Polyangiaceae bacterium]
MMNHQPESIQAAGGGYGPPPGGMPPGGGMGAPGGYGAPPPGGAPMAPPGGGMMPGGMPGGGMGGGNAELAAKAQKYFILSICTLCGCGLFAIIPIIFANQAKEAVAKGDIATAESKLGTVKIFLILWVIALVLNILAIIAQVVIGIAAS